MPFSINVVLQLHSWIYRYLPNPGGQWKTTDNEITEIHSDGKKRVRFILSNAFETPSAMEKLRKGYQISIEEWRIEPLIVIPVTILDFLSGSLKNQKKVITKR